MRTRPLLLVIALAAVVPAQQGGPLTERKEQVQRLLAEQPSWPDDLFHAAFLKAVPPARLRQLCKNLFEQCGAIGALNLVQRDSPLAGKFEAILDKGFVMPVTLGLSDEPPHSIVTLWFGPPAPDFADLDAVAKALAELPGKVSFGVYRLGGDEPEPVVEHAPNERLAIGSAFKLWLLAGLAQDVTEGLRSLADVVRLEQRHLSLPSGRLREWPVGTPVTLATLAGAMISESDNTATDHLLALLGRERVEALLPALGCDDPRNRPLLATADMFRLKYYGGQRAATFVERDADGRRRLVDELAQAGPPDADTIDQGALVSPRHIDTIEWFASAKDLARTMDWLRRATDDPKAAAVRGLLAINPGLPVPGAVFPFVGFKGGSEVGVLNLTFLLGTADGSWFAASVTWNDPIGPLDEARLTGTMTRALHLLARTRANK
jgi:hypothetical protein